MSKVSSLFRDNAHELSQNSKILLLRHILKCVAISSEFDFFRVPHYDVNKESLNRCIGGCHCTTPISSTKFHAYKAVKHMESQKLFDFHIIQCIINAESIASENMQASWQRFIIKSLS